MKKSIGRLAKDCKGRKALRGDSTVSANQDQEQDHSSDEDDNPGDMDISSDKEEGESELELEPAFEMEEVGLTKETQDLEAWEAGTMILCSDRKEEMERGICLASQPFSSSHLSYV